VKLVPILLLLAIFSGCTSGSAQRIAFADGHCDFIEAHNFWGSGTAIPCFDSSNKLLGFGQSNGNPPSGLWSSYANAAVIGGAFAVAPAVLSGK